METAKSEIDITTVLLQNLHIARKDNKWCDLILKTKNDVNIPVHKCVLVSASTFFAHMFNSGMKESNENSIKFDKFTGENLENVINFIYTKGSEYDLTEKNAKEILDIALYFNLGDLMEICTKYLIENLTKDNYHDLLEYGITLIKDDLPVACCKWILKNFNSIRRSENLLKLSFESMEFFVKVDKNERTSDTENTLHKIVMDWIEHDLETRRKHIKDLIEHLIYENMTEEFLKSNEIMENEILLDDKFFLLKMLKFTKGFLNKPKPAPAPTNINLYCNYCGNHQIFNTM